VLTLRLLGPLVVERDGRELDLGSPRRRALLALLALHAGQALAVDRLVDELWGERPPKTAAHVIQVYVSELRRALGGEETAVLVTRSPGYALDLPADAIDLGRFEELFGRAQALVAGDDLAGAARVIGEGLALWRGDVLADLAYEGFVGQEARRLGELRLAARELQLEVAVRSGPGADDVVALRELATEHPYRERVHALLVRALAAVGRQAEALDAYAAARRVLDEELGIEPGRELRDAQAAVLRQEVAVAGAARPTLLAAALQPERLDPTGRTADALAIATARDVVLACILVRTPGVAPDIGKATSAASSVRGALQSPCRSAAFAATDRGDAVAGLASEHDADTVVLDVADLVGRDGRLPSALVAALDAITADVVLVPGNALAVAGTIAVPFGGSPHDWLAAALAAGLVRHHGGTLRLIGAFDDADDASRLLARAALAVQRAVGIDAEPALAPPGAEGVIAAAAGSPLIVGVSERWRSEGLGPVRGAIAADAGSVLVVRAGIRPGLLAPREARTRFGWSVAGGGSA
jgi:DNA-binding SARP family transcriptional activator